MKSIGYSGVAFIHTTSHGIFLRPGVKFPKHSYTHAHIALRTAASGIIWLFQIYNLKDGSEWWYPHHNFNSVFEFNQWIDAAGMAVQYPSGYQAQGKEINGIFKPPTSDKIAAADVLAWLSAH